jgi:biotin carboxyl carrier protein
MRFQVSINGKSRELELSSAQDTWECRVDGRVVNIDVRVIAPGVLSIIRDGDSYVVRQGTNGTVGVGEHSFDVSIADPRSWRSRRMTAAGTAGPQKLTASMPGKVVRILATQGAHVKAGQGIAVIEAMKMQNELRSPRDGKISSILVEEGKAVNAGEVVAVVE